MRQALVTTLASIGVAPTIFAVCALLGLAIGAWLFFEQWRYAASAKRLAQAPGRVREAELMEWRQNGNRRAALRLKVDFTVDGKAYCCERWELFGGNRHLETIPGFEAPKAGAAQTVLYDRADPRVCATHVGKARYVPSLIALAVSAALAFLAFNTWERLGG